VIAHRISTVRRADKILVMQNGSLVATGTHEQLMDDNPIYAEIVASQLHEDKPLELAAAGSHMLTPTSNPQIENPKSEIQNSSGEARS
jgi:ABC-type multidrug transport system ATPase subunit